MARRRYDRGTKTPQAQAPSKTVDSFQNVAARVGLKADNLQKGSGYVNDFISRDRLTLESAYRTSWIAAAAVNTIADDMTREGITLLGDIDVGVEEQIERMATKLKIWHSINSTVRWARLYGGAVGLLMIDGQDVSTPLNMETVAKDQFKGIFVLDRWMLNPTITDVITDMNADLGKPMYYETIQDQQFSLPKLRIHHSRVIRMEGMELPYYQRLSENGWSQSVLEALWDRLIAFDSTTEGAAQLVYKAHLRTLSIESLRDIISMGGRQLDSVMQQVDLIRKYQSNEGLTLIDSKDSFEAHSYTFSGLSDMIGVFAEQVSGALGIPLVRLFGQTPKGLNATGDSEIRSYYDQVRQHQERMMRSGIMKTYELIYRSVTGDAPPEGFDIEFAPLWTSSDEEKASINSQITSSIVQASEAGIIDRDTALKELRQSAAITGIWSNITDENIADAEDEPPPTMEMNGEQAQSSEAPPSGAQISESSDPSSEARGNFH